jgi:hypothetical protein
MKAKNSLNDTISVIKSWKVASLGEDVSDTEPGLLKWGMSIGRETITLRFLEIIERTVRTRMA